MPEYSEQRFESACKAFFTEQGGFAIQFPAKIRLPPIA
jgi:hypothetical protein